LLTAVSHRVRSWWPTTSWTPTRLELIGYAFPQNGTYTFLMDCPYLISSRKSQRWRHRGLDEATDKNATGDGCSVVNLDTHPAQMDTSSDKEPEVAETRHKLASVTVVEGGTQKEWPSEDEVERPDENQEHKTQQHFVLRRSFFPCTTFLDGHAHQRVPGFCHLRSYITRDVETGWWIIHLHLPIQLSGAIRLRNRMKIGRIKQKGVRSGPNTTSQISRYA
jgi:hypothetical protein